MLESCKGPCGKRLRGSIGNEWRTGENNNADVFSSRMKSLRVGVQSEEAGSGAFAISTPTSQLEEEVR